MTKFLIVCITTLVSSHVLSVTATSQQSERKSFLQVRQEKARQNQEEKFNATSLDHLTEQERKSGSNEFGGIQEEEASEEKRSFLQRRSQKARQIKETNFTSDGTDNSIADDVDMSEDHAPPKEVQ